MATQLEHVEALLAAFEARDYERIRQMVSNDFVFMNPNAPNPEMSVDQWLGFNQMMTTGFPDLTYNFEILEEKGNQVWVAAEIEGTHDGNLDLSPMGMGVIPPTGKFASAGRSITVGTYNEDGLIRTVEVIEEQGGGPPGMFAQIGVDMG